MKTYKLLLLVIVFFVLVIPSVAQDKDQDGFPDSQDACPFQPAPNSTNGCPPVHPTDVPDQPSDRDGDGMIDVLDNCPNDGGPAQNGGCPDNVTPEPQTGTNDSDGDGFPDDQDACPNEAGAVGGCVLVVLGDDGPCVAATKDGFRVNIRESALENAAIVGQLLPTETKLITGITVSSNNPQSLSIWVQVDIGFINTSVIRLGGDCSDVVSDDEGEPTMSATFALEYDCSTTLRVIIISDATPTSYYMGQVATYTPWLVYPSVLAPYPRPTEPDVIVPGHVIIGTPCDDLIIGTDSVDIIDGLGGNDMIIGLGGYDAIVGNEGNDQLFGYTLTPLGAETVGNTLIGGDGNDNLNANSSASERLEGGLGDDTLIGNGADLLRGGSGNDRLTGSTRGFGGSGNDNITGTSGDDRLFGEAGDDRLTGGAGNDMLDGGNDNDWLLGELGDDVLMGGSGRDGLYAQFGSDALYGGEGDDWLDFDYGGLDIGEGENGNDRIDIRFITYDSLGLDRTSWEAASHPLEGSHFYGGNGDDTIVDLYSNWEGVLVPIKGDDGNDNIQGGGYVDGGTGNDVLYITQSQTTAYGGDGDDIISVLSHITGTVLLYGDGGNDHIVGHQYVDLIFGGEGNDSLIGMEGGDYLNGGNGDDVISGGPNIVAGIRRSTYIDAPNFIDSGGGHDTVDGGPDTRLGASDSCLVDGSDTVISCEFMDWPFVYLNIVSWQRYFDMFGIRT